MSARDAVLTAEQSVSHLRGYEAATREIAPHVFDAVRDAFVSATLAGTPVGLLSETSLDRDIERLTMRDGGVGFANIKFAAQDAAQRRLWQQHRIVYDIDAGLWAELGDTGTETVLPADLFTRLPHPDPFITFPEPLVLGVDDRTQQRIRGFFVRGVADVPGFSIGGVHMSTHHPSATHVGLTFVGEVETRDGAPVRIPTGDQDVILSRVTLDPREGQHTVGEMIASALTRFGGTTRTGRWQTDVPLMMSRAVSLLVYLCADADLTPLPRQTSTGLASQAKKGKSPARKSKPSTVIGVGYRIGAALAAYRKRERDTQAAEQATGRTVAPHVRRAHFHVYRVGPGRQESIIKWIAPTPVNMHGPNDPTTAIPVRAKDPAKRTLA